MRQNCTAHLPRRLGRRPLAICSIAATTCLFGCIQPGDTTADDPVGVIGTALALSSSGTPVVASSTDETSVDGGGMPPDAVSGRVEGRGNYQLFDLGAGTAGDHWAVTLRSASTNKGLTVVLLDGDLNLAMRSTLTTDMQLSHILRANTGKMYLGVASQSDASDFTFKIDRFAAVGVPAPAPQTVWLNFGGGQDVRVHRRSGISFPAFAGDMLGTAYSEHTDEMKATILAQMRADFAAFNVAIFSSDEGPPPSGPYAAIQFGGEDDGLLGLADNVDMYNADPEQTAVVYVRSFAGYEAMDLPPDEMAAMIANVASHELGHLLGLYHTKNPTDIMDTTGTAWDLASSQRFSRAALEPSVFPTGMEDSPVLLQQTVGLRADVRAQKESAASRLKADRYARIRGFAESEIKHACGTCLHLDD